MGKGETGRSNEKWKPLGPNGIAEIRSELDSLTAKDETAINLDGVDPDFVDRVRKKLGAERAANKKDIEKRRKGLAATFGMGDSARSIIKSAAERSVDNVLDAKTTETVKGVMRELGLEFKGAGHGDASRIAIQFHKPNDGQNSRTIVLKDGFTKEDLESALTQRLS